ncbi:DnaJ-domain-containing protein [Setomelanomma holmii]|uniref:DnaJ-domain-containing protein n=1 Tax=Setomelanomma holmii TaxID=210430 RepID=A0A9P4H482_9PLEO|nr:DnaJ-domain-containing protein [Setomelanomma holmii]
MGAGQSTSGGEAPGGGEVKTSYYELLGVERTATQDELKKAYRKKALELHPDRNHGDTERTTALFAEIQSAYEVLSDDQERAWYDAHEGDILRGGSGEGATEDHYQGNMRMTTSEELTRMMGRFRSNIDFTDSPSGFFGFLRETFEQLAKEEEYAADYEDLNISDYPTFGHKDDAYDDVVRAFYSTWNGFSTVKSFAWMDRYRLSDAPDRRTRRAMEKENQKFRDDGRREFNEAVQTLVAFVRKRDPRYTPNTQSADERAKAQRDARKAQAARARAAQIAKLEQEAQALPSWATARPADEQEEESEEEIEEEHYECVACSKTFKSERQYEAHEKSKKHQKAIQSLKRKMQKDNAHLHLDEDALSSGVITPAEDESGVDATGLDGSVDDLVGRTDKLKVEDDETDDHDENVTAGSGPQTSHNEEDEDEQESEDEDDDEYASRSDIEARLNNLTSTDASTIRAETPETEQTEDVSEQAPKVGKAAQKRAKRAAKEAESAESAENGAGHKCLGCDAAFPSKTRLHQHLQDHPKHAALKSVPGKGKKKGRR